MPSIRTKLALMLLNQHAAAMRRMQLDEARNYFNSLRPRQGAYVMSVKDHAIAHHGRNFKVRTYQHHTPISDTAIIYFHGGGFAYGGLESHDNVCRLIARRSGFMVAAVDYSLAPEHPYPAAIEDGVTALSWLGSSMSGINRVILIGDSAGANIALHVVLNSQSKSPKVVGEVLIYPALDPSLSTKSMETYKDGHFVTRNDMRQFWNMYTAKSDIPYIWPLPAGQLATLPPTLVIGASYDVLHDEGQEFFESIQRAGVSAHYVNYDDMAHSFIQWPGFMGRRNDALGRIASFCKAIVQ